MARQEMGRPRAASCSSDRRAASPSAVDASPIATGPSRPVYGSWVTSASPAISASRSGRWKDVCPRVWPGVGTARGEPGSPARSSRPSGSRGRAAPDRALDDHGRQAGEPRPRRPVGERRALAPVVAGRCQQRSIARVEMHGYAALLQPRAEAEMVDVPVRQQQRRGRRPGAARSRRGFHQRAPRTREARRRRRHAVIVLDQVPVDEDVVHPVDPGRDLTLEHRDPAPTRRSPSCRRPPRRRPSAGRGRPPGPSARGSSRACPRRVKAKALKPPTTSTRYPTPGVVERLGRDAARVLDDRMSAPIVRAGQV